MVRILEIVASMDRGGVETTLMNIFRMIDKNKIVFDFLLATDRECAYNEEIRNLGGRIYSVPNRKKGLKKNRDALDAFFAEHKEYQIVHMHAASLSYIEPLKAAKRYGIPVRIIHSRNTKQNGSRMHILLHYFHQIQIGGIANYYFACSDLAGQWMYGSRIPKSKRRIINNGINSDKFVYDLSIRNKLRSELEIEEDEYAIVNVGRLSEQKNHIFILDIFRHMINQGGNYKLFLVGDGKNKEKIKKKIKEYGLEDRVTFVGVRSDINKILQAMDLFLMPSLYEGLPGSAVEAQGSSLPCLLSDTITKEVAITDLVKFMSLKEEPKVWAKEAISMLNTCIRRNTQEEIIKAGFDMKSISNDLQSFYLSLVHEEIG